MTSLMLVLGLLMGGGGESPAQAEVTYRIALATPVSMVEGRAGASMSLLLTQGKPQVWFAASGQTLCQAGSATMQPLEDAGFGWRVEVVLRQVAQDGSLVLDATWQRRWQDGRAALGAARQATLRLAEGGRVQLDYLSSVPTPTCGALGMALELSRATRPPSGLFEVDAWLMPVSANAGEALEHVMVRTQSGSQTAFYFAEVPEQGTGQIEGALDLGAVSGGRFESQLRISRRNPVGTPGGSSTFPFSAAFGEVVEFRVPMGGFSLRLRVRQLR